MADLLTVLGLDNLTLQNDPPAFVLWFRPDGRRAGWEVVSRHPTERQCVKDIGCGGRRNGSWLVLPSDRDPDR